MASNAELRLAVGALLLMGSGTLQAQEEEIYPRVETDELIINVDVHGEPLALTVLCAQYTAEKEDRKNILFLHGANHNARVFRPLFEHFNGDASYGDRIHRACAIDLPGHGLSAPPEGMAFSAMGIDYYVSSVKEALAALDEGRASDSNGELVGETEDYSIDALVGHSMGGMIIQRLAETEAELGTPLNSHHGINDIMLIASTLPEGVDWEFADTIGGGELPSPEAVAMMTRMMAISPELGMHIRVPPLLFVEMFMGCPGLMDSGSTGEPPTLTSRDVAALNDVESITAWLELYGFTMGSGLGNSARPQVSQGRFEGYNLHTVSMMHDPYITEVELTHLNGFLRGSDHVDTHVHVNGNLASHDGFYLAPNEDELTVAFHGFLE